MTADKAAEIYQKLKPFLRVSPNAPDARWPAWQSFVKWGGSRRRNWRPLTFEEFLLFYKIPITHDTV